MHISQKCQYTLRALFELAKRRGGGPASAADIAAAQAIPPRFLELILHGLKDSGAVDSRRGSGGGYVLAISAKGITVGDIIRSVDGSLAPVECLARKGQGHCLLKGRCSFTGLWQQAQQAIEEVYDSRTLQDLVDGEQSAAAHDNALEYSI